MVNMSEQTAHISALLAVVHVPGRRVARRIRSAQSSTSEEEPLQKSQLGPVPGGSSILIGSFDALFEDLIASEVGHGEERPGLENVECVEIRVIAESIVDQGNPVGASRKFFLLNREDGDIAVRPSDISTQQLRSSEERRTVRGWLSEVFEHEVLTPTASPEAGDTQTAAKAVTIAGSRTWRPSLLGANRTFKALLSEPLRPSVM